MRSILAYVLVLVPLSFGGRSIAAESLSFETIDATGRRHGFLQLRDGSAPIVLDYPGAVATIAMGINPAGVIVGQYTDTQGRTHGFLIRPAANQ
jgi:hypothetical protein